MIYCRNDAEITGYALDAIYNVVSNEPSEEGNILLLTGLIYNNCQDHRYISACMSATVLLA